MDDKYIDRIKELLNQKGVSVNQMTKDLAISVSTITDWSKGRGKPMLETMVKIADYLGVSIDYIVYGINPKPLEMSNEEYALYSKFNKLPANLKPIVSAYMDGMVAANVKNR